MSKSRNIHIENKNALLELLREGRNFQRIYLAHSAHKDSRTKEILAIANQKNIDVFKVGRKALERKSRTEARESIIGVMKPQNQWKLQDLLENLEEKKEDPFFLILDNIHYSLNIGAILRTSFAGFVNGVISPISKRSIINDEVLRVSMGAAERVPIVHSNLFTAIKVLKENAVKVFSLETGGTLYSDANLTGAVAIILGAEDVGISTRVLERSDDILTLPMREGIGSLNVNASASVIVYEKLRQEIKAKTNFIKN